MKTIVLAYHSIGCVGIKKLLQNNFEILAIFTHKDDPGENIWFDSVAELAAQHDIPVYSPENINHPMWVARIKELNPDILFSFYYRNLIAEEILSIPPQGCLNLHGSYLPKYRGRCPVNWVLVNGETETGVTLHYMTRKPDDGDIAGQHPVAIDDEDSALTLFGKLADASNLLLDDVLPKIKDGSVPRRVQDASLASYFGGRTPKDGEIDWSKSATEVRNLVRAVTRPYPGAFSYFRTRKCLFWQVAVRPGQQDAVPGTILSVDPLVIACGQGAVEVQFCQEEDGLFVSGKRLAGELKLSAGMLFTKEPGTAKLSSRKKHVLILGVNGFIGNHLSERLLASDAYEVHGIDLNSESISHLLPHPHFHYTEGDIAIMREWIEYHVRKCDVILPLVAIATPIEYVRNPLQVFELDFEENLRVIRYCVKFRKRLIFPSTSEVYGMNQDNEFDEENSNLVLGPIHKQRWIYSCCKQMLDRVIWAYGIQKNLDFTLFRPFNWIGPKLDSLESARIGSSRVITQFILNLVEGNPINLVDGGSQKRCFTDVKDGIDCLYRIIENATGNCSGQIFNIGNPDNEYSMAELATLLRKKFAEHSLRSCFPPDMGVRTIEAEKYYGNGYQDVQHRRPSIKKAKKLLGWQPVIHLEQSITETLEYFLQDTVEKFRAGK